jgi:hypothetical protein
MMIHAFRLYMVACLFIVCDGTLLWAAAVPAMPAKPGLAFTILRKTKDKEDIIIDWPDACEGDEGITMHGTLYILTKQKDQLLDWRVSLQDNNFEKAKRNIERVRDAKRIQAAQNRGKFLLETTYDDSFFK